MQHSLSQNTKNKMPDLSFHIEATLPVYKLGTPISLGVTLTNHSSELLEILSWGTPLEQAFKSDMFDVSKDGTTTPYIGRMVKRATPKDSDYLSIAPAKTLAATIDLSKGYAIQTPGTYTITMKPRFISTHSEVKFAGSNLLKAESNTIVIEITE
ncbi:MAG: hypothetical protein V3V18_05810 [Methylococcales bacterium]